MKVDDVNGRSKNCTQIDQRLQHDEDQLTSHLPSSNPVVIQPDPEESENQSKSSSKHFSWIATELDFQFKKKN